MDINPCMRGRIIHYQVETGTGLIAAGGEQYVFAIGQWRSEIGPAVNQTVELKTAGTRATQVALVPPTALIKERVLQAIAYLGLSRKP